MDATIRPYTPADRDAVVDLSLRAWAPVFASLEQILGPSGVFALQHPDWRADQRAAVSAACDSEDLAVWVAVDDGAVAGFATIRLHLPDRMGELEMIAVDPAHQRRGIGAALTAFALQQMREAGMTTGMIDTGGDPGHAPARRVYERAGMTLLPVARYFTAL